MAIRRVTSAAQLNQALSQAASGDTIVCAGGSYGSVAVNGYSKSVTIASEGNATFRSITISKSANLKLDGLEVVGGSIGVLVRDSRNITITDSDFERCYKGLAVNNSDAVQVTGNTFAGNAQDAMAFGGVNGLVVAGNRVAGMQSNGLDHKDMIQLHDGGGAGPCSNVIIRDNVLDSNDGSTHGIYVGGASGAHRNIVIDGNDVIAGHVLGISVARTAGLKITDNTVLKDGGLPAKGIHTPEIRVDSTCTGVVITGNTAHGVPGDRSGWTVSGNTIVGTGARIAVADATAPGEDLPVSEPDGLGAEAFRFEGDAVRGWTRATAEGVDLDAGDTLELAGYEADTFRGQSAGLSIGDGGRAATMTDAAALKALIAGSADVEAAAWSDSTLALRVEQSAGTHSIVLRGLEDAFALI